MKSKTVAIVQSNYIPWKGYFDLINSVDEFILFDDVQYTRRDWRNRNLIKTSTGLKWLTIPVETKGKFEQAIKDTRISDTNWGRKHWLSIQQNYHNAKYFFAYRDIFETLYLNCREPYLSRVNFSFIETICRLLGISTRLSWSMDYPLQSGQTRRLVGLCQAAGAGHYVSGPAAKNYLDESLFAQAGIAVSYFDYSGYPVYTQNHGAFEHGVTILDLLFHEGPNSPGLMKSFIE